MKYNILFASDLRGMDLLISSAHSFCEHLGKENTRFYVLCSGWNETHKERINKVLGGGIDINYIDVDESLFSDFNNTVGLPKETLYRLRGIELLPDDVHYILYADIDILCVSDSIKEVFNHQWDINFKIAAVPDAGISDKYAEGIMGPSLQSYFNAGVLFFNVDYCRAFGLWKHSRKLLEGNTFKAVDQDILNILFRDSYYPLSNRFNYMSPQVFKDMMFYRKKNLMAGFDPILIHFDGPHKPWYSVCANPYKGRFEKYQRELNLITSRKLKRGFIYKLKIILQFLKFEFASL